MKRRVLGGAIAMAMLWAATAVAKPTDAQKCEAAKDKATAKYCACRLQAYAKSVTKALPADYTKCDAKQMAAWAKAETKYGAQCPTTLDQAAIQMQTTEDVAEVAAQLAGAPLCGNAAIDPEEQCDGSNLNGQTCVTLGYERGTLACSAACAFNTSACEIDHRPATGQTTSYTLGGDDGSVHAGHALAYVDNGNGTITDLNTHLMWEKKVVLDGSPDAANLHDADNCYPWRGTCHTGGADCSVDADCGANGPCDTGDCQTGSPNGLTVFKWVAQLNTANFGTHNDWRIPNAKELQSIVDYEEDDPSVSTAFQGASCGAACTDMTNPACSCTASAICWSSSTLAFSSLFALGVDFNHGLVDLEFKTNTNSVRAVRGGL